MGTPLFEAMENIRKQGRAPFHMPGHKGNPPYDMSELFLRDITEVEGADSLYHAEGAIASLEREYAELYGSDTSCLSAGGSTLCIQTMLSIATQRGDKVIASRMIHSSAVATMALLEVTPHWIWPKTAQGGEGIEGLALPITPAELEKALDDCPEAVAVYITSPDYMGQMADISALSKLCHDADIPLLVDNAHGAHLHFLRGYEHPITAGADMCCDSLHKTLPVLTGGAMLHISNPKYSGMAKGSMALFGSTSPSYPIMLSADLALSYLKGDFARDAQRLTERLARIRQTAVRAGFCVAETEPHRLTIGYRRMGYTDGQFSTYMRGCGIEPEYLGGGVCVLMASPCNTREHLELLEGCLGGIPLKSALPSDNFLPVPPPLCISPTQAVRGAVVTLSMDEDLEGRIAARPLSACPPGIPLALPGEELTPLVIKALKNGGITVASVVE